MSLVLLAEESVIVVEAGGGDGVPSVGSIGLPLPNASVEESQHWR